MIYELYIVFFLLDIKTIDINNIYHEILSIVNFKSELAGIGPIPLDPYAVSEGHKTSTLSPIFNYRAT